MHIRYMGSVKVMYVQIRQLYAEGKHAAHIRYVRRVEGRPEDNGCGIRVSGKQAEAVFRRPHAASACDVQRIRRSLSGHPGKNTAVSLIGNIPSILRGVCHRVQKCDGGDVLP